MMDKKRKPELLIPASSLEVLKTAVMFGADAVYIGGEAFGLRAKAKNFSKEEMKSLQEEIPLGRIGTGADIAKTVLFLEENDYITGVDIPVNGGFSVI